MITCGARTTLRMQDGRSIEFTAESVPPLDRVLEHCLVSAEDPSTRPGRIDQKMVLDDRYAMKSWRRDERFRIFFGWEQPAPRKEHVRIKNSSPVSWPFRVTEERSNVSPSESLRPESRPPKFDPDDPVKPIRGRMIWSHKTAPELEIEGRGSEIDPDEIARGRRR